jgi:hypothetical protein
MDFAQANPGRVPVAGIALDDQILTRAPGPQDEGPVADQVARLRPSRSGALSAAEALHHGPGNGIHRGENGKEGGRAVGQADFEGLRIDDADSD